MFLISDKDEEVQALYFEYTGWPENNVTKGYHELMSSVWTQVVLIVWDKDLIKPWNFTYKELLNTLYDGAKQRFSIYILNQFIEVTKTK